MFIVSRIVLGTGIVYAISGASQLLSELSYPKERAIITGLFNESWYAGAILAAGVTLGTYSWKSEWAWRLPSLLQLLPSALQLTFIWYVLQNHPLSVDFVDFSLSLILILVLSPCYQSL